MNKPRSCGCKGMRSCYVCENEYNIVKSNTINLDNGSYIYCYICNKAWPGWSVEDNPHETHHGEPLDYEGIYIKPDFLSDQEEDDLIKSLDDMPWDVSQSGRRKQNFGPKCNFKKRKIKLGAFQGFPDTTKFVQEKFESIPIMKNFITIEQCSLEYDPEKGAHIDPHIDDCWIWGERIITVNLLSDSILTMTYNDKPDKYNLDCVETYPTVIRSAEQETNRFHVTPITEHDKHPVIRVPMPRKSLLVMYGAARYNWAHRILRDDIIKRRVCLAYREFTPPYLNSGKNYDEVKDIFIRAKKFYSPTSK